MDAVTKGALEAGKPVGGFKIGKEAGQWTATNVHPYLPSDNYLTCRYFVLYVDEHIKKTQSRFGHIMPNMIAMKSRESLSQKGRRRVDKVFGLITCLWSNLVAKKINFSI